MILMNTVMNVDAQVIKFTVQYSTLNIYFYLIDIFNNFYYTKITTETVNNK